MTTLPASALAIRPPPLGCNGITADGQCSGTQLQYCDTAPEPDQLITIDCTVDFGAGAMCVVDANGRAGCSATPGGPCLRSDSLGNIESIMCPGTQPGCLESAFMSECADPLPPCGPNDVGLCSGDRLVRGCNGTQPWLLDCPAYGGTCMNMQCVGADIDQPCGPYVACAAPNVCGRLSRCEAPPPMDAGVADAAPRGDGGTSPDANRTFPDAAGPEDASATFPDASAPADAAAPSLDATARADATAQGAADASVADALATAESDDGCSCDAAAATGSRSAGLEIVLLGGMIALIATRRRRSSR